MGDRSSWSPGWPLSSLSGTCPAPGPVPTLLPALCSAPCGTFLKEAWVAGVRPSSSRCLSGRPRNHASLHLLEQARRRDGVGRGLGGHRTWRGPHFPQILRESPAPGQALLAAPPPPPPQLTVLTFCFAVGVHPFCACWGSPNSLGLCEAGSLDGSSLFVSLPGLWTWCLTSVCFSLSPSCLPLPFT